jgi:putative peptidoglycan lipid II flippase
VFAGFQWISLLRSGAIEIGAPTWGGPDVGTFLKGGLIAILVISAPFVRGFLERVLASTADPGDLASLGFATRLILALGAVVAVSVGTVAFPTLAGHELAGERARFSRTLRRSLILVTAISLPASVLVIAAPSAIVGGLFEYGQFSSDDTAVTAVIVRAFAPALVAICLIEILLRALFAIGAQQRALIAVYATLALNLALDLWLLHAVGVEGLGIGASIALWLNVGILALILGRSRQSQLGGKRSRT